MEQGITVSQLNRYIKLKLDSDVILSNVLVCGEISNFTNHIKSGHFYFSLKDSNSSIKAVMFKQNTSKVLFTPQNGQKVIVKGQLSVFERDGNYQIYATEMQPNGKGNLAVAFEELKEKLKKEGLFDSEHKKSLPQFPEKIGIITSPTGAAVQDMINVLTRRYSICEIYHFYAIVQGENAPQTLISGIDYFNKNKVDVILLGRGGGSTEDLWCFNDENLARAIYNSQIPIISCVGHETDYTISDFAADMRAPTPSAAAEIAVPDENTVKYNFLQYNLKLENLLKNKLILFSQKLSDIKSHPCLKNSEYYLENRLNKLNNLIGNPCLKNPDYILDKFKKQYVQVCQKFNTVSLKNYSELKSRLGFFAAKLDALSPLKVLSRGYSITFKNGKLVTANDLNNGDMIDLQFCDGNVSAIITEKKKEG